MLFFMNISWLQKQPPPFPPQPAKGNIDEVEMKYNECDKMKTKKTLRGIQFCLFYFQNVRKKIPGGLIKLSISRQISMSTNPVNRGKSRKVREAGKGLFVIKVLVLHFNLNLTSNLFPFYYAVIRHELYSVSVCQYCRPGRPIISQKNTAENYSRY